MKGEEPAVRGAITVHALSPSFLHTQDINLLLCICIQLASVDVL